MALPMCSVLLSEAETPSWLGTKQRYFRIGERAEYEALCALVSDLVGDDCWAVVVDINSDREILFSSYQEKGIRDMLLDDTIRSDISEHPGSVFLHFHRAGRDRTVSIFINQTNATEVRISYNAADKSYTVKCLREQPAARD